jgi:hypothetical protein
MACLALKSNGVRCRNYAVLEEGRTVRGFTCSSHKHYFEKPEKIKRSWLKSGAATYLHYKPGMREHVELALANGLITITKHDIQNVVRNILPRVSGKRWAIFLLFVAQYTEGFHPEWNPALWKECVSQLWYLLQAYGPMEIKKEDVQVLICVRGGLKWWYEGLYLYPDYGDRSIGFDEEDWFAFLKSCLDFDKGWGVELLSQLEDDAQACVKGFVSKGRILDDTLLTERLLGWKRGKLAEFKENCRFRIFEFKEDLIAFGWHPDRFMKWCVDWEEKKDMEERWREV